ncbi:hypothetical protein COU60_04815 [Candidatus Pacearchaeota archaeon CG10_big_fil_rev_8_21_14_0_10_34_76]|nr:MAG: hypothetical protein COU60_04815 [Candidatus Pacearchaeota archaeon CG10_big_fil_rev_8_21_14_0_10_34_76]
METERTDEDRRRRRDRFLDKILVTVTAITAGTVMYALDKDWRVDQEINQIRDTGKIYNKVVEGTRVDPIRSGNYNSYEFGTEYWGIDDNCDGNLDRILKDPFFKSAPLEILHKGEKGFDEALHFLMGGEPERRNKK